MPKGVKRQKGAFKRISETTAKSNVKRALKTENLSFIQMDKPEIKIAEHLKSDNRGQNRVCEITKSDKEKADTTKEKQAEYHGNQYESGLPLKSAEVQKPIETREELAKVAGVSHDTIAKVEKIEQKEKLLL